MHENLLPVIEELEQAVEARDAAKAVRSLDRLEAETIYSQNEVYDRLHAIEPALAIVLFEGLEPFAFVKAANNKHLHDFKLWAALEEIAERVSGEWLWLVADGWGFPSARDTPRLHANLAAAGDESISRSLIDSIERLAEKERSDGASQLHHERTLSMFMLRWRPDDGALSDRVRLLAAREDGVAKQACVRFLRELPWGADRYATCELIDGLIANPFIDAQSLFRDALERHRSTVVLRIWLWRAIGSRAADDELQGLVADLASAEEDESRVLLIESLSSALHRANSKANGVDPSFLASIENLNTRDWSLPTRGLLGAVLRRSVPQANPNHVSRRLERSAISLAHAWETVRIDHMGCLIPLALMMGGSALFVFVSNLLLGPPKRFTWAPPALWLAWLGWAICTVRTHFSGHESIRFKVNAAIGYFSLLLAAIAAAIAVRI